MLIFTYINNSTINLIENQWVQLWNSDCEGSPEYVYYIDYFDNGTLDWQFEFQMNSVDWNINQNSQTSLWSLCGNQYYETDLNNNYFVSGEFTNEFIGGTYTDNSGSGCWTSFVNSGCTDSDAQNFNEFITIDDGSCEYEVFKLENACDSLTTLSELFVDMVYS